MMIQLLINDGHGIYIPQHFASNFEGWGLTAEDIADLSDPENEFYWDAWDAILNKACFTDDQGYTWSLHQDGCLFAIRDDLTEEQFEEYFG